MHGAIQIHSEILTALLEQARKDPQKECCGLLAGRGGVIMCAFPATNVADNTAKAYEIGPEELFRVMRKIRMAGLELLGIFHSHPAGENRPSAHDIERAYYPAAVYFIVSLQSDAPQPIRAFSIREGKVTELEIQVV
ncbi:MAG TPA: M67 family metallopeptidase [Candidatus Limnocylindria bacterium]|nr:M67 family metallopeptidase [Candidatus Limnocylindria bacterium]